MKSSSMGEVPRVALAWSRSCPNTQMICETVHIFRFFILLNLTTVLLKFQMKSYSCILLFQQKLNTKQYDYSQQRSLFYVHATKIFFYNFKSYTILKFQAIVYIHNLKRKQNTKLEKQYLKSINKLTRQLYCNYYLRLQYCTTSR